MFEILDLSDDLFVVSRDAIICLCIYFSVKLVMLSILIYCFQRKLYQVNKLNVNFYDAEQFKSSFDSNTETKWMNQLLIDSVTRHSLLSLLAMICDTITVIGSLTRYIVQLRGEQSFEFSAVSWYIAVCPTWLKIFAIYLSFGYTTTGYDRLCNVCHSSLKAHCKRSAIKQLHKQHEEQEVYRAF